MDPPKNPSKQQVLRRVIQRTPSFFDHVETVERGFISLFTLGVGAIILYEIVVRNLGMQGLKWIDELGRIMLITTTLVGCSVAVRHHGHMVMDALYSVVGQRAVMLLRCLSYLIAGFFYLYLAGYSVEWTLRLIRLNRSMQTINLPAYLTWLVVSLAMASMGLRYLVAAAKVVVAPRAGGKLQE